MVPKATISLARLVILVLLYRGRRLIFNCSFVFITHNFVELEVEGDRRHFRLLLALLLLLDWNPFFIFEYTAFFTERGTFRDGPGDIVGIGLSFAMFINITVVTALIFLLLVIL